MTRHHEDEELPAGIRAAYRSGRILDDRRDGVERRDEEPPSDPSLHVRWSIVAQLIAYVVGLFVIYNVVTARLTTLETNRQNDIQRMERIESKLDRLLERPSK